jgi:hypothetical protein
VSKLKEKRTTLILLLTLCSLLVALLNVETVRAPEDSWVWVRNTVTGAWGEAVVGIGDAIYVARKMNFYSYDPVGGWTTLANPPNPDSGDAFKTGTALAWDSGDHIYALYGAATSDSRKWFSRYSISGNSWEVLVNTPADQGEGDSLVCIGNSVYATVGGEQRPTYFMRYDVSTDSWSDTPANPPAGMGDGASLVWTGGDFLYALRGEFDETSPLCDFWRYSISGNVWTAMTDIPAGADGEGGVGDGGSLIYVGSWLTAQADYIYALSGNQVLESPDNRTYRYTISLNSWERLADLPFKVGYYVGCRLGYADGYIYAWQGTPSTWTGGGDDLVKYEVAPDTTPPTTTDNYDKMWHTSDFTITLVATDVGGGVAETYYKINDGSTQTVSTDGDPFITTESANNKLEYWSVDNADNEELPHKILTGIKLDKTAPTIEPPSRMPDNDVAPYQEVNVSVNVADPLSAVKNVALSYSLNDSDLWIDLPMTLTSTAGVYEAIIPGQAENTVVSYTIAAYDNAGNYNVEDKSGQYHVYTVVPEFQSWALILFTLTAFAAAAAIYTLNPKKLIH